MNKEAQTDKGQDTKELIALIAHDLRSIINGIYGLNQLLGNKLNGHPDTELRNLIQLIGSQCELGADLTGGLVEDYGQDICILNDLLAERTRLYKYQADHKNITLTTSFPHKNIDIQTQRATLIRILDNLFDNAVKFTPRGGNINVSLTYQDHKAVISVSDTGIGIPAYIQPLLFDRAPQIQRPGTENEPSTGLGLYTCKQLTEALNGTLWFDSIEYTGTTFHLSLSTI